MDRYFTRTGIIIMIFFLSHLNNNYTFILLKTLPFWPETESMRMYVKFRDSKSGSQHFSIIKEQQTVLRMDKGVTNNKLLLL